MTPLLLAALLTTPLRAQDTVPRETWSVSGEVQLGKRSGPTPVRGNWVTVHRIASDPSGRVSGGALDSARTDGRGRYTIRFPHFGQADATYIAITSYSGVSYITAPLTRPRTVGDDAAIMVFDTTTPPYPMHVAGRHLVITAPDSGDRRRVVEVYELLNDSTFTVMSTEANPAWRAPLPTGVEDLQLNPVGDITSSSAKQVGDWLHVFAPISPGVRQLSFTYSLPAKAFPLALPIVDSAAVFELLVQEPGAVIEGGGFTEVAGVVQEGMPFRRLLAQNVPARAVVRFSMPAAVSGIARRGVGIVAWVLGVVMVLALAAVFWMRRRSRFVVAAPTPDTTDQLIRELATLDADFERLANPDQAARDGFAARRAALKAQIGERLTTR